MENIAAGQVANRQGCDHNSRGVHSLQLLPARRALKPALLLALLIPAAAQAEDEITGEIEAEDFDVERVAPWSVGVAFERSGDTLLGGDPVEDQLIGPSLVFRGRHLGLNLRLMASPADGIENVRGLFALGARGYHEALGLEWSYGIGTAFSARLEDHFWIFLVSPVELGAAIYRGGSARIDLFLGARYFVAGDLINTFLIDPNGFNNEAAQAVLDQKRERGWEVFVTLVFAHILD